MWSRRRWEYPGLVRDVEPLRFRGGRDSLSSPGTRSREIVGRAPDPRHLPSAGTRKERHKGEDAPLPTSEKGREVQMEVCRNLPAGPPSNACPTPRRQKHLRVRRRSFRDTRAQTEHPQAQGKGWSDK